MLFSRLKIYTVHTNPDAKRLEDGVRFVPENFSIWAFIFTLFWALYHRLWGFALVIAVLNLGLYIAVEEGYLNEKALACLQVILQLWVGYQAHDALRGGLRRRGFALTALTSGETQMRAEQRYFDRHAGHPLFAVLS